MNNKKGFTLIEVLAIIILLGIIIVIIAPKVVNTIRDSKKKSYEVSVNNIVKSLNSIAIDKKANLVSFEGCSIDFDNDVNTCTDLKYSGELPTSGSITVDSNGNVNGSVGYGDNRYLVEENNVQIDLLPIEYVHVNYIESTGTQYINTEYIPDALTDMEIEFEYINDNNTTTPSSWYPICGERSGSGSTYLGFWINKSNLKIAVNYGGYDSGNSSTQSISRNARFNLKNSGSKFYLNGNMFARSTTQVTKGTTPIYIFTIGYGSGVENRHVLIKLYSFKIYEENVLVRNMVPCYRKSDNVIGLYDVINGKFYTNSGTGEFIKG